MRARRWRTTSQLLFAVAFFAILVLNRYPYSGRPPGDLFLRASPLLPLAGLLEVHKLCLDYWPALIILAATFFLGRFFCGWICPMGATIDLWRWIIGRSDSPDQSWAERLSPLPLVILVFVFVPALCGIGIWSFLDPLALFHRIATVLIFPLFTWLLAGLTSLTAGIPIVGGALHAAGRALAGRVDPEGVNHFLGVWPIAIALATILLLELAAPRFWCRFVCPAGAWLGLLSRRAPFTRRIGAKCVRCAGCRWVCPMGAIPKAEPASTRLDLCTVCLNCLEPCPPSIACTSWGFGGERSPAAGVSRREFLGTVVGSVATVGTLRIGLANRLDTARLLRPPGSVPEPLFLDRCIRCLSCVRMCRTNGGCLQPGKIHSDLLELWAPEAVMRAGYCEYSCNLCGKVCPTGVIRPLTVEEKQKTPMGMAYFDRNLCIPYCRNENCMVCEEHCPVPDKAIQFEDRAVVLPDGKRRTVKLPYVVRELCIGCGICETKCPLPGAPGIFVVNENAVRPLPPG